MNAISFDIVDFLNGMTGPEGDLIDNLSAENANWSLRKTKEEPTPARHITIYDTGGTDPEIRQAVDHDSIQVRVRGKNGDYNEALQTLAFIRDTLMAQLCGTVVNAADYLIVQALGGTASLGYDEHDRPLITQNFLVTRQPEGVLVRT